MTKHTPGPWEQTYGKRGTLCVISDTTWICGEIENPHSPIDEVEAIANARLIAAAPDLLEALEGVSVLINSGALKSFTSEPWVGRVQRAIAKATGEDQ